VKVRSGLHLERAPFLTETDSRRAGGLMRFVSIYGRKLKHLSGKKKENKWLSSLFAQKRVWQVGEISIERREALWLHSRTRFDFNVLQDQSIRHRSVRGRPALQPGYF